MFDTIVIGNDISSLIAAVTTSMSGKRTVLLREGAVHSVYSTAGYTFNIDPFPWTGFGPNGVSRRFMTAVDSASSEEDFMYSSEPSLQFVCPEHRIDFTTREHTLAEFKREFPGDTAAIEALYEILEHRRDFLSQKLMDGTGRQLRSVSDGVRFLLHLPSLIWHRRSLSRRLTPFQHHRSLQGMIDAATLLFSNLTVSRATPFVRAYALTSFFDRQFCVAGEKHRMVDRLNKIFSDSGGTLMERCTIFRLEVKDTVIMIDIEVNGENCTIGGRDIIVSEKWEKMRSILCADTRFSRLGKRCDAFGAALHPFTIHVGINDSGIPEKMSSYVILLSEDTDTLANGDLLFIELSFPTEMSMAPRGKRAVCISAFLDESPRRLSSAILKEIAQDMLMRMERAFPFFRDNIDHLDIERSIDISRQYQEVVCRRHSPPRPGILGVSPFPSTTAAANVFITGGMTLAGLGFVGEVLSGIEAAQHVIGV
jgi:phytoene dehydrogenase-like protein